MILTMWLCTLLVGVPPACAAIGHKNWPAYYLMIAAAVAAVPIRRLPCASGREARLSHGMMIKVTGDRINPCAILDLADWADLENAHGPAFPDTPAKLRDLVSGDLSAVTSSLEHLHNALLNDGVVYSATAPAFRYVAALVGDRPSRAALAPPWEAGRFPLRARLLAWLAYVAIHVSVAQEQNIREWGRYPPTASFPKFVDIRNIYPEALAGVASCFGDPDSRVVEAALVAAVRFSESPVSAARRGELAPLVERVLAQSSDAGHRSFAHEVLSAWRQGLTPIEPFPVTASHVV